MRIPFWRSGKGAPVATAKIAAPAPKPVAAAKVAPAPSDDGPASSPTALLLAP